MAKFGAPIRPTWFILTTPKTKFVCPLDNPPLVYPLFEHYVHQLMPQKIGAGKLPFVHWYTSLYSSYFPVFVRIPPGILIFIWKKIQNFKAIPYKHISKDISKVSWACVFKKFLVCAKDVYLIGENYLSHCAEKHRRGFQNIL